MRPKQPDTVLRQCVNVIRFDHRAESFDRPQRTAYIRGHRALKLLEFRRSLFYSPPERRRRPTHRHAREEAEADRRQSKDDIDGMLLGSRPDTVPAFSKDGDFAA
jgi:hypothetical protein